VSLNLIGDEMFRATGNLTFWFRFGWSELARNTLSLSLYFLRNSGSWWKSISLSLHSSIGSGKSDHKREPNLLEVLLNGVE
jgi:hypothetical protein